MLLCSFLPAKTGIMTQKAIDMTQAKQIQQLSADGVSIKEIVRRTGISRKTVRKYLRKIEAIDHALQLVSHYLTRNWLLSSTTMTRLRFYSVALKL